MNQSNRLLREPPPAEMTEDEVRDLALEGLTTFEVEHYSGTIITGTARKLPEYLGLLQEQRKLVWDQELSLYILSPFQPKSKDGLTLTEFVKMLERGLKPSEVVEYGDKLIQPIGLRVRDMLKMYGAQNRLQKDKHRRLFEQEPPHA